MLPNPRILRCATTLVFAGSCSVLLAQETPKASETVSPPSWKFGAEADLLPYATGGYYGSAFFGYNGWRCRAVAARSATPGFLVTSGFEKKRSDAYAFLLDRFIGTNRAELKGFWVGGGGEFWQNRIRQQHTTAFTHYDNFGLTAGGGYVWSITKHFYLNPWSAVHVIAAGDRQINVSGRIYRQPLVTPEVSLKFGFIF